MCQAHSEGPGWPLSLLTWLQRWAWRGGGSSAPPAASPRQPPKPGFLLQRLPVPQPVGLSFIYETGFHKRRDDSRPGRAPGQCREHDKVDMAHVCKHSGENGEGSPQQTPAPPGGGMLCPGSDRPHLQLLHSEAVPVQGPGPLARTTARPPLPLAGGQPRQLDDSSRRCLGAAAGLQGGPGGGQRRWG